MTRWYSSFCIQSVYCCLCPQTAIPELNDSRWIGLCIYNVVVLGSVGVILVLGTRQAPHVTYVVESAIVIAGTTLTQCFVFIPKVSARRFSDLASPVLSELCLKFARLVMSET